jgi:hypothetical protein
MSFSIQVPSIAAVDNEAKPDLLHCNKLIVALQKVDNGGDGKLAALNRGTMTDA